MDIDYDGFLTEIQRIVSSQGSGIIRVIQGTQKPVVTIGVLEGKIVSARFGAVRGSSALEKIQEMENGTLHVQSVKFRSMDEDLPGTKEILSLLGCGGSYKKRALSDNKLDTKVAEEGVHLHEKVRSKLGSLFGPSIESKLDAIARKQPPHSNPESYLSECQRLVEIMLGKSNARKIFEPFLAELNTR